MFGIIALLAEYKDSRGNITKWGRRALLGVVMSTSIAVAATGLELIKE